MTNHTVITIGRQLGSGGKEVGLQLAEELGIKCYDKELLERAAKDSGLCQELFENNDEKPTNSFLYSLVMDTYSLKLEMQYRILYEKIRNEKIVPDFSLDSRCSNTELYDANATWLKCLQSPSIWMFYVPIIIIGVIIVSLKFAGVI